MLFENSNAVVPTFGRRVNLPYWYMRICDDLSVINREHPEHKGGLGDNPPVKKHENDITCRNQFRLHQKFSKTYQISS